MLKVSVPLAALVLCGTLVHADPQSAAAPDPVVQSDQPAPPAPPPGVAPPPATAAQNPCEAERDQIAAEVQQAVTQCHYRTARTESCCSPNPGPGCPRGKRTQGSIDTVNSTLKNGVGGMSTTTTGATITNIGDQVNDAGQEMLGSCHASRTYCLNTCYAEQTAVQNKYPGCPISFDPLVAEIQKCDPKGTYNQAQSPPSSHSPRGGETAAPVVESSPSVPWGPPVTVTVESSSIGIAAPSGIHPGNNPGEVPSYGAQPQPPPTRAIADGKVDLSKQPVEKSLSAETDGELASHMQTGDDEAKAKSRPAKGSDSKDDSDKDDSKADDISDAASAFASLGARPSSPSGGSPAKAATTGQSNFSRTPTPAFAPTNLPASGTVGLREGTTNMARAPAARGSAQAISGQSALTVIHAVPAPAGGIPAGARTGTFNMYGNEGQGSGPANSTDEASYAKRLDTGVSAGAGGYVPKKDAPKPTLADYLPNGRLSPQGRGVVGASGSPNVQILSQGKDVWQNMSMRIQYYCKIGHLYDCK